MGDSVSPWLGHAVTPHTEDGECGDTPTGAAEGMRRNSLVAAAEPRGGCYRAPQQQSVELTERRGGGGSGKKQQEAAASDSGKDVKKDKKKGKEPATTQALLQVGGAPGGRGGAQGCRVPRQRFAKGTESRIDRACTAADAPTRLPPPPFPFPPPGAGCARPRRQRCSEPPGVRRRAAGRRVGARGQRGGGAVPCRERVSSGPWGVDVSIGFRKARAARSPC
jgi:hypothetical protein